MGRFQSGPSWTFAQRRNGALTRPDFALLPMQWGSGKSATWTARDSSGHYFCQHGPGPYSYRSLNQGTYQLFDLGSAEAARSHDVRAIGDPANKDAFVRLLSEAPRPSWHTSVHEHVAIVTEYLQDSLANAFPTQAAPASVPL